MTFAVKLKGLRERRGQSLQQVADDIGGVSRGHLWELETGKSTNPGVDLLQKIAKHFNVTVAYLLEDSVPSTDAAALQFFREFKGNLSQKDWDTLKAVADRLKDTSK